MKLIQSSCIPYSINTPLWHSYYSSYRDSRPEFHAEFIQQVFYDESLSVAPYFWMIEPTGAFYNYSMFSEDRGNSPYLNPSECLDFTWVITGIAETIATALAFSKSLNLINDETNLEFQFRWRGLSGREITTFDLRNRGRYPYGECHDDEIISNAIKIPSVTSNSNIYQYVIQATKKLFNSFNGSSIDSELTKEIVDTFLSRRR